ncbi:MAG: hypothetical protein J5J06_17740 [Phycisphaerae bacterium]|nr:hypothetical protein [Phycisphaerae bacterium]
MNSHDENPTPKESDPIRREIAENEAWLRGLLARDDERLDHAGMLKIRTQIAAGEEWLAGRINVPTPPGLAERVKQRLREEAVQLSDHHGPQERSPSRPRRPRRGWILSLCSSGVAAAAALTFWITLQEPRPVAMENHPDLVAYEAALSGPESDEIDHELADLRAEIRSAELAWNNDTGIGLTDDDELLRLMDDLMFDAESGVGREGTSG